MSADAPFIAKYGPMRVADFHISAVHQRVIQYMIRSDSVNLLLCGDPGAGKTALMLAIAREYYGAATFAALGENDVLSINNLKEQGIGFFKADLRTFCRSACSIPKKKKMVLIDNIDTIAEHSQQVFRNYIDKYSHRVNFVAVCTNAQKVADSFLSRVQTMRVSHPSPAQIAEFAARVIVAEHIEITPAATAALLAYCGRSPRSVLGYLEKIYILGEPVTETNFAELVTDMRETDFVEYFAAVRADDTAGAIHILYNIHDFGYSVIDILEYMFFFVKSRDEFSEAERYAIVEVLCKYIAIFNNAHEDVIELALFTDALTKIKRPMVV
jgi:DNA polymerase III delta prime subunit